MASRLSLSKFMKKYSTLRQDFIDDFFNIWHKENYNQNSLVINLDIVLKWLKALKNNIVATLKRSYIENVDYIIKKEKKSKGSGGQNNQVIFITPDCFKRLCMLSRSENGELVRKYYLELEQIFIRYKDYILEAIESENRQLKEENDKLKNNQSEPITEKGVRCIYVLKSIKDVDEIYRFGKTKDFKKRLKEYNSSHSDKMQVLYVYRTKYGKKIENCVINQIKEMRYLRRKDFYKIDSSFLNEIIEACSKLTIEYQSKKIKIMKDENLYVYLPEDYAKEEVLIDKLK